MFAQSFEDVRQQGVLSLPISGFKMFEHTNAK